MSKNSCPHCRTRSGLNQYRVIVLSLENWAQVLLISIVVLAFSEKFGYSMAWFVFFAVLAILPLVMHSESKVNCENCGMDFKELKKPLARLKP